MMRLNRPAAVAKRSKSHASRTPCERHFLVFAWNARRVRFASRCGGGRQMQSHHCVAFAKRHTMMRLRSLSAAATAR
eukprot:6288728-Lingulodinium_polyedra.AAC.1